MSRPSTLARPPQQIGRLKALATSPRALRLGMNLWPPFLCSGIRVQSMGQDLRHVRVRLAHGPLTSNYVGTLFGGSLFSMTDPFWMMMVLRGLGPGYVVWDRAAEIEFVSPGRGPVVATFDLSEAVLDELRAEAESGRPVLRWFDTPVVADDGTGTVVARVRKQLYVRRRRP